MYFTQYTLGLCMLFVGVIQGAQNAKWEDDFAFNDRQRFYAGGEDEDGSTDEDYDPRDGYVWPSDDSDDDLSGSGGGYSIEKVDNSWETTPMTECVKLEAKMQGKQKRNQYYDYIPKCTENGAFEEMQCNPSGLCWCVNNYGQEIPETQRNGATRCYGYDRTMRYDDIDEPTIIVDNNGGIVEGKPDVDDDDVYMEGENGQGDKSKSAESGSDPVLVSEAEPSHRAGLLMQPLILAGIIAFAVVCLLCAVLLVMFIVYRMRKKDEGSYALDEPKRSPSHPYQRAPTKEYFA